MLPFFIVLLAASTQGFRTPGLNFLLDFFGCDDLESETTNNKWDGLKAKFNVFASLPRTETDAKHDGFTKISDCGDISHFAGKRYAKAGDEAVVLLYDSQGYIAGIQAGFYNNQTNGYPTSNLQNKPFVLYKGKQYITVYFVDPETICGSGRTPAMFSKEGTGTDMYIQNGATTSDLMHIPHAETAVHSTKWTKGRCFPRMGMHYWYNTSKDMNCDDFFPVFLLYNKGKLNAFGWAFLTDLNSTRYEHPPPGSGAAFFNEEPTCLANKDRRTTMHIYMTDSPQDEIC